MPFVNAKEVELITYARGMRRGDDELGERRLQTVLCQKAIEGLRGICTQGEGGGLDNKPYVEGWRVDQTGERPCLSGRIEQGPRRKRPSLRKERLQVGNQQRERREAEGVMDLLPIEPPDGRGRR